MKTKSKTVLVAAFLAASVSGALAYDGPFTIEQWNYERNPNAPVPQYAVQNQTPAAVQGRLFEGRNVGVQRQIEDDYHRSLRSENSPAS